MSVSPIWLVPYFTDNWDKLRTPVTNLSQQMCDVWDGVVLRWLSQKGCFFSKKHHIAFSMNTDGVPLFKSSSWNLWPVLLSILNFPANIRMKAENVILAGLWYGPTKPPMKLLLEPVMETYITCTALLRIHISPTQHTYLYIHVHVRSMYIECVLSIMSPLLFMPSLLSTIIGLPYINPCLCGNG